MRMLLAIASAIVLADTLLGWFRTRGETSAQSAAAF
jgi:hypothetical protein